MKNLKKAALFVAVVWLISGVQNAIFILKEREALSAQSSSQELSSDLDSKVKALAEKAAIFYVHTILGPFEQFTRSIAGPGTSTNHVKPLILDESWLELPEINKPSVEERMKPLEDAINRYRSQEGN